MYDVVIIGAGAAGLIAAGVAASGGKKVLIVEKMEKAARKVRITGKGRCNITNTRTREEFLSKVRANVAFFAPSFDAFDNQATVDFFRNEGLALEFERGERVFPASGKAWDVANALTDWATESGAEIEYHTRVTGIRRVGSRVNGVKIVNRRNFERNIECQNVIIATGGVSYPATGSTGDGYGWAYEMGHQIEAVRPALVSLKSNSALAKGLEGVKLKNVAVRLLIDGELDTEEFGEMEFGSRGLEGAVMLRLSRSAVDALIEEKEVVVSIDMKSALTQEILEARLERELESMEEGAVAGDLVRKLMPKPMLQAFAEELNIDLSAPISTMDQAKRGAVIDLLKNIRIPISDYGSFDEAIITAGGVCVDDIDPLTLQSKLVSGLYFAGEVLDIDADTGGYNLQIAFSTGWLAGGLKK